MSSVYDVDQLLPLEKYLYYKDKNGGIFPSRNGGYFQKYYALKCALTPKYRDADLNACFIDNNYYTHHGLGHVNDVILYVGKLIGVGDKWDTKSDFLPFDNDYSVYILLVSILLHDVGMYYGRDGHEELCHSVLLENKNIFDEDQVEMRSISNIAKAHSGKYKKSKDTISNPDLRVDQKCIDCQYDAKELSALVRFADEICETKTRAKKFAVNGAAVAGKSKICHTYCSYINAVEISEKRDAVTIEYVVPVKDLKEEFLVDGKKVFIIDEIGDRLDKINRERIYCNRYFGRRLQVRKIIARIDFVDSEYNVLNTIRLVIEDSGYPDVVVTVKELYPDFSGVEYKKYGAVGSGGSGSGGGLSEWIWSKSLLSKVINLVGGR